MLELHSPCRHDYVMVLTMSNLGMISPAFCIVAWLLFVTTPLRHVGMLRSRSVVVSATATQG